MISNDEDQFTNNSFYQNILNKFSLKCNLEQMLDLQNIHSHQWMVDLTMHSFTIHCNNFFIMYWNQNCTMSSRYVSLKPSVLFWTNSMLGLELRVSRPHSLYCILSFQCHLHESQKDVPFSHQQQVVQLMLRFCCVIMIGTSRPFCPSIFVYVSKLLSCCVAGYWVLKVPKTGRFIGILSSLYANHLIHYYTVSWRIGLVSRVSLISTFWLCPSCFLRHIISHVACFLFSICVKSCHIGYWGSLHEASNPFVVVRVSLIIWIRHFCDITH